MSRPPGAIRSVPVRHPGRWVAGGVIALLVAWLVVSAARADVVDTGLIRKYQFHHLVLMGLRNTLVISVVAQAAGIVLGVLFALMRMSRNPVTSIAARFYIWFFRGTPVLVQLFFWYNAVPLAFKTLTIALPFTHVVLYQRPIVQVMTPFMAAFLGLGLNEGAYMAEIVRAGVLSVDEGQTEAAAALGMTRAQSMRRIVLPQALRVIVPPTGNEFISMLKTSSLAEVVLYRELLRRTSDISSTNLHPLELLIVASIWYLVLTTVASVVQQRIERRLARARGHDVPDTASARVWRNLSWRTRGRAAP